MYESYFDKLRDECYLRNRTARTADAYISNITYFLKYTGKQPDELTLEDEIISVSLSVEKMGTRDKISIIEVSQGRR